MVGRNGARGPDNGSDDGAWFEPKTYGYGAGPPIAWQGWALILAFFVVLGLSAWLVLPHSIPAFIVITIGATAALILICAMKTRGGWRWRSGKDN
jgi:hypothetical protein